MMVFDRDAYYSEEQLRQQGFDGQVLRQATRKGALRCRKVGRSRLYKGEWLMAWLDRPEEEEHSR